MFAGYLHLVGSNPWLCKRGRLCGIENEGFDEIKVSPGPYPASKAPPEPCIKLVRIPIPAIKNTDTRMGIRIFWQRMRDSNPRERSQSPVCYRYTNPLCWDYYTQFFAKVKKSFRLFQIFSSQGKGFPVRTSSFRYRKVASSPWSRSMVRIWRSCLLVLGCIRSRSRLRSK